MKNEREIIRVTFRDGKNNMCIVSERRPGESKLDHEMRIIEMKKIMIASTKNER